MKNLIARLTDAVLAHARLAAELHRRPGLGTSQSNDDRLLLLVNEFAPAIAGGVYRPAALARYATLQGWRVTVVTSPASAAPTEAGLRLLEYVGGQVEILRTHPSALRPSHRLFPDIDGGLLGALDMVALARRRFGANLPGTIVATGPTFNSFAAGYMLARTCQSRLILEYRDEWTLCPFDFVAKESANRAWELRCLKRADSVVFTTASQRSHHERVFGQAATRRRWVVENGWEPEERSAAGAPASRSGRCVLTFAGKLGGHTDPGAFLGALDTVLRRRPEWKGRLLFRFVGAKRADALQQLQAFPHQEVIALVPIVPQAEATRMMGESDALMLFHDPRFERYLPGKLYEYIASGVPIVLVDDEGESSRLIEDLGLGWSVKSENPFSLEAVLDKLLSQPSYGAAMDRSRVQKWLEDHTRSQLAARFLAMAKDLHAAV